MHVHAHVYAMEAVAICHGGCDPMCMCMCMCMSWRLWPYAMEAVTLCVRMCMCMGMCMGMCHVACAMCHVRTHVHVCAWLQVLLACAKLSALYPSLGSRNTWAEASDVLQGYYAYFRAEAADQGCVFEVQFHTPTSYQLKETKVDQLIVRMREEGDGAERARLVRRACKIWHSMPVPAGARGLPHDPPLLALDEDARVELLAGY